METFIKEYQKQLTAAVEQNPDKYTYGISFVPEIVNRIRQAIQAGSFNKDGLAFKMTCKVLGIKHTYKDIAHFIANHE